MACVLPLLYLASICHPVVNGPHISDGMAVSLLEASASPILCWSPAQIIIPCRNQS